ncbi:MAG: DUF1512 domain-containing protein [Euryarchaeota archaeon]|nr:DUF1512 domain-containing protein [Euryarchaeota archaeon]MBU4608164.1 DUF1512 domain-containing protein [Euryarchaeota archaeon]MBV1730207.1 DUF1512 domain-containing protein [Methanobacterium sp.]MBV1754576.1 DUF1512 domain-containing protein [Methanobacterium sp.]
MIFGDTTLNILVIMGFILLILIFPWLMRIRMISSVTRIVRELEEMVTESKKILVDTSQKKGNPSQDPQESVENFMQFFVIPPVNMDPAGIVKKFDQILELGEERFHEMVNIIAPDADSEIQSNIIMALKATIGLNGVAKLVRHNLELSRKTGNLQLLLSLQMNLPIILRLIKSQFESVKSFSEGKPIGDGLGPLVASLMMQGYENKNLDEIDDMIMLQREFQDRNLTIIRAKGPGARIGKVGKISSMLIDKNKIDRIISIDAAIKLEGEKTGTVAEGIGVVIGGPGMDKWFIEEKSISRGLKMDAIIVKMSPEEAISPMTKNIRDSSQKALKTLENSIKRSPEGSRILIIGVGNSCGIPHHINHLSQIEIKKEDAKIETRW